MNSKDLKKNPQYKYAGSYQNIPNLVEMVLILFLEINCHKIQISLGSNLIQIMAKDIKS